MLHVILRSFFVTLVTIPVMAQATPIGGVPPLPATEVAKEEPQVGAAIEEVQEKLPLVGFQEWRKKQISSAESKLKEATPAGDPITDIETEKLRQLEFNLEIAKGLTIHDFFALYLKNKGQAEMAQITAKLTPEELSELLMAYKNSLYGIPTPKKDPKTALKVDK